ncbi:MAG TPA: M48 family metalloprotease [Rhodanobacteraceae bacterium]|nr:M48 family metalloprotease [Rhodanobacteraceae bacterium]
MNSARIFPFIAAACISGLAGARDLDVKLPDIGSSAGAVMSQQDQQSYGASVLHELRSYGLVLDDALLDEYLNALGYKLVANSDRPDLPFTFFIVRDNDINAFAVPGGYIAANAGLIINMSREDELAAVLAHEISHITQQHLLRAFEDMKKMSLPTMLAMLGILIASSHTHDDTGTAAIMTGTSLMQQRQINFTRHDEAEADRVGIQTMARAGYDPLAMADTFATLQRIMRVNGVDVPEFLLDHPVDTHRIADAKARAQNLTCSRVPAAAATSTRVAGGGALNLALPSPRTTEIQSSSGEDDAEALASSESATVSVDAHGSSPGTLPRVSVTACGVHTAAQETYFELMRERARVLSSDTPSKVRAYYADNLQRDPSFDTPPNRYGYALALTRSGAAGEAAGILRKLVATEPNLAVYRLGLADALDQSGNKAESLAVYEQLGTDFPGSRAISLSYADALIARADVAGARRAQELLRPLVERYAGDPDLQKSYARACQLGGDKVRAAEAYAEAAYLNGHAEDALNQLKTLSKEPDLTFYQRSRVDARITELTPEVLALRKRGTPEPDSPGSLSFTCCRR